MIYTCSHNNYNSNAFRTIAISGNRGSSVQYNGECYPTLAPKLSSWLVWHTNIGIIPEEENNYYYIKKYYEQVLSVLDPQKVFEDLNGTVLLCYEDSNEFCHRHIVADWLEIKFNIEVPECHIDNKKIKIVQRPEYIKNYLQDIMNKDCELSLFKTE